MASKAIFLRAILTFKNPAKQELLQLNNLIWEGNSLTGQELYIWNDEFPHALYTNSRLDNLKVTSHLSAQGLTKYSFDMMAKQTQESERLLR